VAKLNGFDPDPEVFGLLARAYLQEVVRQLTDRKGRRALAAFAAAIIFFRLGIGANE
jgi:hypothetical protein